MKHSDYLKKKKARETRKKIISVIAAFVVFVTTYALVLPAITLDVSRANKEPGIAFEQMQFKASASAASVTAAENTEEDAAVDAKAEETKVEEIEEAPDKEEAPAEEPALAEEPEVSKEEPSAEAAPAEEAEKAEETVEEAPAETVKEEAPVEDKVDANANQSAVKQEDEPVESAQNEESGKPASEEDASASNSTGSNDTAAIDQTSTETAETAEAAAAATTEAATEFQVPEKDPLDFDEILTDKTDFYFYHVENAEEAENLSSDSVDDWKKVGSDTILAPEDFVRVYLSYEIPAGALNETNTVARYTLPKGLELSDKQIEAINKYENGVAAAKSGSEHDKYLGAEAIEGDRTPDEKAGDENISATVKVDKHSDGSQELVFTYIPYTVEKNKIGYDEVGEVISEGKKVKGFFTFDLTTSQIDFEKTEVETVENEDGTTKKLQYSESEVVFVKKDDNKIERKLTLAALIEEENQETKTLKSEGSDYTVTVTYTDEAQIPDNAELAVREIEKDTEEYASYLEQAQDVVDETKSVNEARFFDITILVDGKKIEPQASVSVQITFAGIEQTNADDAQLLHYKDNEEVEVMDKAEFSKSEKTDQTAEEAKPVDTVQFETDGFSIYGIVGTELKKEITLTTPDGEDVTYVVSVSYGPEANIPEGAYLDVTEYDSLDDKYIEAWDAVVTAKKNAHEVFDENHLGLSALDISIKDSDGNNIEPTEGTSVKVSIQMKELPKNVEQNMLNDTMEVQHLNESTGDIAVETVAKAEDVNIQNGIATAAFTIDSFSTFTITWSLPAATVSDANASFRLRYQTPNQWSTNAYSQNVRVWYVDESGNNIQKPTGRNDVTYNANNYPNVTINLSDYEALSGYEFIEARYSADTTNKPNGQTIDSVQFVLSGNNRTANYIYNENIVATNTRTNTTSNDTGNVYLVYRSNNQRVITVHYGYMSGGEFVEFDSLPAGAQTTYGPPAMRGDQLNVRYDIPGKDYVTTRMGNPSTGTQISPLLQTENQANYSAYPYWKYRVLNTLTANDGINEWQRFTANEDLYVIYRDTPTEKSYDDQGLDPEDLSAPSTNKDVQSNNDGTYDINLSVTGASNSMTNKTHANVVIVLDTSSSMNGTDTGVAGQTRLQAAKNAITNVLADELFGFNSAEDPEAIEVAFVDFSHRVRNEMTKDTIYSGVKNGSGYNQFVSLIDGLNNNGGTNYDTAIEAANSILWNDADPVYVIFVTDGDTVSRGYLEYDEAGNTFPTDWDGGTYYNAAGGNDYLARARSAAQVQVNKILANSNNKFYSIGVFGNVQYLQALGGTYLGQANNESAIREAFTTIIDEIALNLGYEDVTIHDGITAMTSTSLVNGVVNEFHYSVTKNGVTTEYEDGAALQAAYPGIGLASYANKQVTWEMGDQYMLEDGVTYTVSFTVWPSQDAYDYLADFSNGVKDITAQSTDTKKQFFVQIGSSTYQYVADKGWTTDIPAKDTSVFITDSQMKEAIEAASSVTYYLRTNTSATVDYTSVKFVDGEETERKTVTGSEIKDPNGKMVLDSTKMKVAKEFAHTINSASPYTKLNFYLKRDGKYYNKDGTTSDELDLEKIYTIELPKNNNWWDEIFIAPGLIEKETGKDPTLPPLETGHDYSVEEKIITGNVFEYEFTPQTVRPMVIGTTLTFLVKKDKYNTNSGNAKEYELPDVVGSGTSIYYVASENNGSLIGTNRKTSELDITKVITDVDADESGQIKVSDPRYNESFTYRVTLSVPADGDPSGIMGYEYVPRLSDPVNGTTRVNIYGYQEDAGSTVYEPDTTRFKGRTYGAWNTQAYKYFVQTYQSGTQTLVTRDEDGNFIWLQGGDGVTAAKKETIGGKDYYTITLDVTIKMDEVYRFNNLPSGTKYKIQEIYWNKYKADGGSAARTIVSDNSNIDDSGYDININTTGSVSTTDVENDTVSGTIEELDTRYYNQFENTLSDEPDIIQLQVTKHLQGYNWSGERYYFRLSAINGAPMPASLNEQLYISSSSGSDDKSYAFGYIRFTDPGTYQYKITELDPATAGISGYTAVDGVTGYGAEKTITITVDEDLKVTEVTGDDTTFANKLVNTTFTNTKGILVQLLKLGDGIFDRPLDGVTFELYEDQACTKKVTKDVLGNDIGINGVITTADGGMADLGTLKTGMYYLKETGTVDGYNKLTDLISVEVKADGTVSYNQPSYTDSNKGPDLVYQDENGDYYYYSKIRGDETDQYADSSDYTLVGYRIVVSNLSGVELPHTGGSGTLPYTLSGFALMMASALMYGFRLRRRERRLN